MRSGSSTTAAATTGPASGPRPASSQPATGKMPLPSARRSRRNVGRSTGSLSGRRGFAPFLRLPADFFAIAAKSARKAVQVNALAAIRVDGGDFSPVALEQLELLRVRFRLAEMLGGELAPFGIEAELLAGHLEPASDHPGIGACALHARAPGRVIVLAAAHVADQLENMGVTVGIVRLEPFAEQVAHFKRQAQQHKA